jgi:polysaccharide pyruvyl transferase WcaK-like protein
MVEAVLRENIPGATLITEKTRFYFERNYPELEFTQIELRRLFGPGDLRSLASWYRVGRISVEAKSLALIGADTLDGNYSVLESVAKIRLVNLAAELLENAKAFGFSWAEKSSPIALRELRRARLAQLCVRDPRSLERLARQDFENLAEVSDLTFCLEPSPLLRSNSPAVLSLMSEIAGQPFVVINLSGLTPTTRGLFEPVRELAKHLIGKGYRVVLVPHVARKGDSDLDQLQALADELQDSNLSLFVARLPAEVSSVIHEATLVLTSRMHLAITALRNSVPVMCFATQGKVEGLFRMFDLDDCVLQAEGMTAPELIRLVEKQLLRSLETKKRIELHLPGVKLLAKKNFLKVLKP